MTLFVDTSAWSLAFRRDQVSTAAEVRVLRDALEGGDTIVVTGLVLQECCKDFRVRRRERTSLTVSPALPLLAPDRLDHIDAAELRNRCRRAGLQIGTIDAVIAQLCIRHDLMLLTTDNDFVLATRHCALRVWKAAR